MERRDFLKIFSIGSVAAMSGQLATRSESYRAEYSLATSRAGDAVAFEDLDTSLKELARSIEMMSTPAPVSTDYLKAFGIAEEAPMLATTATPDVGQYLAKMSNYESPHREDTFLSYDQYPNLISTFKRLDRVQNLIGHGNFNVVSFDEMLRYGKSHSSVGEFPSAEKAFLEELFAANAAHYGFFGDKVITNMTASIPERDRLKVRRTGHFLYRGDSENLYLKLQKDVGDTIVLTSGIRSVVKQSHLFLAKTIQSRGNLSKASRSLAPPGHSYHGIGDFDVGKRGLGRKNFTEAFAKTEEFKKLVDLGYVDIRYPKDNLFGVRYEPWHIKVV